MITTRFLFILLLLLNTLFFAASRGWLDLGSSEEPGRVSIELHPEYVKILGQTPPPKITQIDTQVSPDSLSEPEPEPEPKPVCLAWSGLSTAQNNKLTSLFSAEGIRVVARDVQVASSWRVRVPPLPTREAAEILIDNMIELGLEKSDVQIEETGENKYVIVIGETFRNRQSVERYFETIKAKGINASIETRNTPERRVEATVAIKKAEALLQGQPFAKRYKPCSS